MEQIPFKEFYELNKTQITGYDPTQYITWDRCYDVHFIFENHPLWIIFFSIIFLGLAYTFPLWEKYANYSDTIKLNFYNGLLLVSLFLQGAYLMYILW